MWEKGINEERRLEVWRDIGVRGCGFLISQAER